MLKNGVLLKFQSLNSLIFILLLSVVLPSAETGCSKSRANASAPDETPIKKLRDSLGSGSYEETIKDARELTSQVPASPFQEEALYLQAYALVYGRADFQGARSPLHQLLDLYPQGKFAMEAQKLLADCQYWQGHYQTAGKEYKKLETLYSGKGLDSYALLQGGNCLLLDDKVNDALALYKELVDKYPTDPLADSAQLMVANSYLKLQNTKQAKAELRKLMSLTHDNNIQHAAQKALRQIDDEEPLQKGVGVPE